MEWSKVKSILIALLVVTNVILGVNIHSQLQEQRESEHAAMESALTLLRNAGISFDEQAFWDLPEAQIQYSAPRSEEKEAAAAGALLGDYTYQGAGGGIAIYSSEKGSVTFRNGGLMEARLVGDVTAQALLEGLLQAAGTARGDYAVEQTPTGVRAQLYADGHEVIGAVLECEDTDGGAAASGRWIFASALEQEGGGEPRAEMTVALLQLNGDTPFGIETVEAVCAIEQTRDGGVRLIPAWRVDTKNEQIILSCMTKKQIPAE